MCGGEEGLVTQTDANVLRTLAALQVSQRLAHHTTVHKVTPSPL